MFAVEHLGLTLLAIEPMSVFENYSSSDCMSYWLCLGALLCLKLGTDSLRSSLSSSERLQPSPDEDDIWLFFEASICLLTLFLANKNFWLSVARYFFVGDA